MAILGFLGDLLGLNSGDPTIDAANKNRDVIGTYNTTANNLIDTGSQQAGGYLDQILSQYAPLASDATAKGQLYADALGVNGADGNARATAAYQTSPGYQFQLDQGLQALDRGAAAHGSLQSGQSDLDYLKYSQGLANQDYGSWLSNLGSSGDILGAGLTGNSTALSNLANLASNTASQKTDIAGQVASGYTGANNQQASGESANKQGLANLGGTLLGGLGSFMGYGGFGNSLEGSLVNGIKGLF